MDYNQIKRINSSKMSKLFIIEFNNNNDDYEIKITGTTLNVYKIIINKQNKTMSCDCPDTNSWAKIHNCICKHCCFLLLNVFKIQLDDLAYFFANKKFSNNEYLQAVDKNIVFCKLPFDDLINSKALQSINYKYDISDGSIYDLKTDSYIDTKLKYTINVLQNCNTVNNDELQYLNLLKNILNENNIKSTRNADVYSIFWYKNGI